MNDDEILKTVEAVLGKDVQIVDCEKTSTIHEEEILLINGIPVTLQSTEASAIKKALSNQEIPSAELLNALLFKAGILSKAVCLETELSVKSSLTKTEEITVARDGKVLDERCFETKEDNFYTSSSSEVWKPVSKSEIRARLKENVAATASKAMYYMTPPNNGLSHSSTTSNHMPTAKIPVIPVPSSHRSAHHISRFPTESSNGSVGSYSSSSDGSSISSRPTSNISMIDSHTATNCTVTYPDDDEDDHIYDNVVMSNLPKPPARAKQSTTNNNNNAVKNCSFDSGHPACTGEYEDLSSHMSRLQTTASVSSSFGDYSTASGTSTVDDVDFVHTGVSNVKKPIATNSPIYMLRRPQTHLPTIFGTVASDQCPKDNSSRRSLPQTVSSGTASCAKLSASETAILDNQIHQKLNSKQKDASDLLDDNALVYRDGNLISGSLDALIQHMVPTTNYYPDRAYLFAFLLSARLFIKPHALLAQICDLCHQQQQLHTITKETPHLHRFTSHFVQLLAEWIDTFPYDFRDERVMKHVRSVTQKCIQITPVLRKEVSTLLQNLLQRLQALERYEEFLEKINAYDTDFLPSAGGGSSSSVVSGVQNNSSSANISHSNSNNSHSNQQQTHPSVTISATLATPDITELCPSSQSLAHQLTHIELERLSYIGPEEFVQAFAKENPSLENTFKDMKKTRNLESYVQWFNRLSYFVATEIVKHPKKKQRVRVVEYWIETARESFNIGNFNSLMAIIAGLNMSPISRLKKTWAKVQSAKFSILEHQMDPSSNFSSYRSTLKAAMWRSAGATDERERIVIPFFSLLVKDLYFLNEGCSNKLPNGHINFEKFWQLAKQVTEFIAWKQVTCPYERNDKIVMFLQTNSILNETTLAWASFECEQPMNHERDRYKSLKHEAQLMNSSSSLGGGGGSG